MNWLWLWLCSSCLLWAAAWSYSVESDATWVQAQAQLGYDQATTAFGHPVGVTLFPAEQALTAPAGCTHVNGTVNGYTNLNYSLPGQVAKLTEYVSRIKTPTGSYIWGKAGSDNCAACNNSCPCPNGTSWGYFPWTGPWGQGAKYFPGEVPADFVYNLPMGGDISRWNYTFEILVQPAPDAGFSYGWQNFSALTAPASTSMPVNMSGSAPCCIPIAPVEAQIRSDNAGPDYDPSDTTSPATWRPQGATPKGRLMGSCDLASGSARFSWYGKMYNISMAQGAGDSQVLVTTPSMPSMPAPTGSGIQSPLMTVAGRSAPSQNVLLQQVTEGVTGAAHNGALGWQPAGFPGGCSNSVQPGEVTSLPYFPITMNNTLVDVSNNSALGVPAEYIPSTNVSADREWYVAVLQTNQTTGRPLPSNGGWALGRAWVDANTSTWQAVFPKNDVEWKASRLVAPANFAILGYQKPVLDNSGYRYDDHHTFTYGNSSWQAKLAKDTSFLAINGYVPCCISASVPYAPGSGNGTRVPIGNVLGTCNPNPGPNAQANITWLGAIYPQDINQARLLTVTVKLRPDPNRTAKIVGGVLGGVLPILLIAALICLALYSRSTYHARAQKRLIQDQVYNLVMGVRHNDLYSDDIMKTDEEVQGSINIDRFYNLLPFVNRMPRNQFYASLSSRVTGRCIDSAYRTSRGAPEQMTIVHPRFDGYRAQALAFSIMRQETCWSNTGKAIVQEWQSGARGRRRLVAAVEDSLHAPELKDFLEGMDPSEEEPEPINSKGRLVTLARMLFFTVPSYRVRHAEAEEAAPDIKVATDSDGSQLTSLRSSTFGNSGHASSKSNGKPGRSAGISEALRMMQLDDYEIKPSEIEFMTNLDGSPCLLGRGAFGEVFKAKYNSVQIVAVKQLREGGDDKAKIDFLREVAIMKKLRAENIVRFLGVCVKESKTMLITEFMAGGDLHNRLSEAEKGGELAWHNKGRRIAVDIARGLAFLHSQQIVHFDLKSPNILLARDHTAKIADVGLARFMSGDHMTQMSVMGTLAWSAPEVMRGSKDCVSTKADVYSFGVVLWEIVTGISPRWNTDWFRPPRVPEECPFWVAELITACRSESAAARPTSKEIYRMLLEEEDA